MFTVVHLLHYIIYVNNFCSCVSVKCKVAQASISDQCTNAESEATNWLLCFYVRDDNGPER